jgi:TIR domain
MGGPDSDVFISFAEEDADQAESLQQAFARAGVKAWTFKRETRTGPVLSLAVNVLRKSKAVVFIISEHFLKSPFCNAEVGHAYHYKLHDRSPLEIVTAVVVDKCNFDGSSPSDFWTLFGHHRCIKHQRPLTQAEADDFARNVAEEIRSLSPEIVPVTVPAVPPPAILTYWNADRKAVTIRIAKDHPRSHEVRECLIQKLRMPSADGSWLESRERYSRDVVPALETILGRGCCPNLP